MSESRYGQPGLYATAIVGRDPNCNTLVVHASEADAMAYAKKWAARESHFILYELREAGRLVVDEPRFVSNSE